MRKYFKDKKKVKWSAMLTIFDIVPRKTRDYTYVILYTDNEVSVCCSEILAQKLCLNEPYEMKGYINFRKGGSYLVLDKAQLFNGHEYRVN